MKDETKQILEIVTQMQKDMVTKKEFGVLKTEISDIKSYTYGLKTEMSGIKTDISNSQQA